MQPGTPKWITGASRVENRSQSLAVDITHENYSRNGFKLEAYAERGFIGTVTIIFWYPGVPILYSNS
ncbi:hypothetical protein BJX76DRAFT_322156 [Aspergillus varians]